MTPIAPPAPASSSLLTRLGVGVSIAVHLVAVALSLGYAGAGLFTAAEPEAVAVSLVTSEQMTTPEPAPAVEKEPEADLAKLDLRPSQSDTASRQKSQASAPPVQNAKSQPAPPPPQPAAPSYTQPQPDISMRYQVDLGLKPLAVAAPALSAQDGKSDFDAPAMKTADIAENSIAAFRAKLKECSALPPQIRPDDKVVIVLRATFTPDAKLAAAPVLIEASASAKGPALMQAAIGALQACQPYNSLPTDNYNEWRVLDLRFTPQDFRKG